jgi:hypothetical protein
VHDKLEAHLPELGLVTVRDAETGATRVVDAHSFIAAASVDRRLADLRRLGLRASAVATHDDAFRKLHAHFRSVG